MKSVVTDSGYFVALFDETDPLQENLARKYADQPMDFAVYRMGSRVKFIDVLDTTGRLGK